MGRVTRSSPEKGAKRREQEPESSPDPLASNEIHELNEPVRPAKRGRRTSSGGRSSSRGSRNASKPPARGRRSSRSSKTSSRTQSSSPVKAEERSRLATVDDDDEAEVPQSLVELRSPSRYTESIMISNPTPYSESVGNSAVAIPAKLQEPVDLEQGQSGTLSVAVPATSEDAGEQMNGAPMISQGLQEVSPDTSQGLLNPLDILASAAGGISEKDPKVVGQPDVEAEHGAPFQRDAEEKAVAGQEQEVEEDRDAEEQLDAEDKLDALQEAKQGVMGAEEVVDREEEVKAKKDSNAGVETEQGDLKDDQELKAKNQLNSEHEQHAKDSTKEVFNEGEMEVDANMDAEGETDTEPDILPAKQTDRREPGITPAQPIELQPTEAPGLAGKSAQDDDITMLSEHTQDQVVPEVLPKTTVPGPSADLPILDNHSETVDDMPAISIKQVKGPAIAEANMSTETGGAVPIGHAKHQSDGLPNAANGPAPEVAMRDLADPTTQGPPLEVMRATSDSAMLAPLSEPASATSGEPEITVEPPFCEPATSVSLLQKMSYDHTPAMGRVSGRTLDRVIRQSEEEASHVASPPEGRSEMHELATQTKASEPENDVAPAPSTAFLPKSPPKPKAIAVPTGAMSERQFARFMRQQQEENEKPSSSKRSSIRTDQDEIKIAKKRKVGGAKAAPNEPTEGDTQSAEGLALDIQIMDALEDDPDAHSVNPVKPRLKPGPKKKDKNKKITSAQMEQVRDDEFQAILVETGVPLNAFPEDAPEKKKGPGKRNIIVYSPTPSVTVQSVSESTASKKTKRLDSPDEQADDEVYCICKQPYDDNDGREMIQCDGCAGWYHPECVGLDSQMVPLVGYYSCPECDKDPSIVWSTTFLEKCLRSSCRLPRKEPLSKYCSDPCGMHHLISVMTDRGVDEDQIVDHVKDATQPEAYIQDHAEPAAAKRIECASSAMRRRNAERQDDRIALHDKQDDLAQRLRLAERAQSLLEEAIKVSEALPDVDPPPEEAVEASKRKGKKGPKAKTGNLMDERRPCGFDDSLLAQGPNAVQVNEKAIAFQHQVCLEPRRKCGRHAGWQKVRSVALEMETASLRDEISRLFSLLGSRK